MVNIAKMPSADTPTGYVAREVRSQMARHGWSQTRLALVLGTTQAAVSRRLTGEVAFDAEELALIGQAFGVHPGEFFPDPQNDKDPRRSGGLSLSKEEIRVILALRGSSLPDLDSNQEPADITSHPRFRASDDDDTVPERALAPVTAIVRAS